VRKRSLLGFALVLFVIVVQAVKPSVAGSYLARFAESLQQQLTREGWYGQSTIAEPAPDGAAKIPAPTRTAKGASVRAPASFAPGGRATSYKFSDTDVAGAPARWRSCAAIPVVIDTAGAPAGVVTEVRTALAQIDAASGLRFAVTATVNRTLNTYTSDNPASPVVIGFPSGLSGVFADASIAGLTSTAVDHATNSITGGTVAFNADLLGSYTPGATGADPRSALLLHELGHLAGLDHVADNTQIMFPYTGYARTFGAGDLAGLRALAPRC
jgi:hypothetical protein